MSDYIHADRALAVRLERDDALTAADYAAALARLDSSSGAGAISIGTARAVATGPSYPINRVLGLGMTEAATVSAVERAEVYLVAHRVEAQAEVCPFADDALPRILGQRGYAIARFANMLVRPLSDLPPVAVSRIAITRAAARERELWAQTAARGFRESDTAPADVLSYASFDRPGVTAFLAWLDGEPVGVGGLCIRDRLATLFSASTRPRWRGRGVQTALIQARLSAAAAAGCDLARVMTVPGVLSQRNLERAGFRVAYTKLVLVRG